MLRSMFYVDVLVALGTGDTLVPRPHRSKVSRENRPNYRNGQH